MVTGLALSKCGGWRRRSRHVLASVAVNLIVFLVWVDLHAPRAMDSIIYV